MHLGFKYFPDCIKCCISGLCHGTSVELYIISQRCIMTGRMTHRYKCWSSKIASYDIIDLMHIILLLGNEACARVSGYHNHPRILVNFIIYVSVLYSCRSHNSQHFKYYNLVLTDIQYI